MNSQDNYTSKTKIPEVDYWHHFATNIIGNNLTFENEHGTHKVLYADWIASGRLYGPIEEALSWEIGPVVANPHSNASYTGAKITALYQEARQNIKRHVNAKAYDVLVTTGSGMSDALLRFQEILGLKQTNFPTDQKPVVFITHMEHHSNHVSWMECDVDVVIVPQGKDNLVDPKNLEDQLEKYKDRKLKMGAFSACSNVTGIINPIHKLAKIMHEYGGFCFADYAASAPYADINMHPEDPEQDLDAIYFSPHKFLGGPGSCGVLIFNQLFHRGTPSIPGGGNVKWTNPWGDYGYSANIETQEDGGTPAFLQTIRASMAITLKEKMGVDRIKQRENELLVLAHLGLTAINNIEILEEHAISERIGSIAFNIKGLHYNLVVRLLNDRFGIQVRGGWSCASTYAHSLFHMNQTESKKISDEINTNNSTNKPGWVRLSLHPTMTNVELHFCIESIKQVCIQGKIWAKDFQYNPETNEFDKLRSSTNEGLNDLADSLYTFN